MPDGNGTRTNAAASGAADKASKAAGINEGGRGGRGSRLIKGKYASSLIFLNNYRILLVVVVTGFAHCGLSKLVSKL